MSHTIVAAVQSRGRFVSYASALPFVILMLSAGYAASARAEEQSETVEVKPPKVKIVAVDEVNVRQETGRISNRAKPSPPLANATKIAPEGSGPSAVPAGATSPNTCDPKNASSVACYTATQQGRGK